MKNNIKIIGLISLITMSFGTIYGCNLKAKENKSETIITQAINNTHKHVNNTVKIALLLDTSNSMDGLIDQAKSQLWDIVNKFAYVKVRCGNDSDYIWAPDNAVWDTNLFKSIRMGQKSWQS